MSADSTPETSQPASAGQDHVGRRVTLAVVMAAALPLVAIVYLALPHLFPALVPGWAYRASWLTLLAMTVAVGLLQVSVLLNYLDLRRQLGRVIHATRGQARPEAASAGAAGLDRDLQAALAAGRAEDVGGLMREVARILDVLRQQAGQVHDYGARFEAINEELRNANLRLREMSLTDELTEVGNRRNFDMRLREEMSRSTRFGHAFSLLMIDIDAFKRFNDEFGHPRGDTALRALGALMRSVSREGDVPCRVGGEEFAFILPETGKADATTFAERFRRGVEGAITAPDGSYSLTVSVGLAAFPEDGKTPEEIVWAADSALYESKRAGRNRVTAHARKENPAVAG
jgi:diguanylate cyclase (GGDEF)-like protein